MVGGGGGWGGGRGVGKKSLCRGGYELKFTKS